MSESLCPICSTAGPVQVEFRESVPVSQNMLFRDRAAAKACPTGVLDIAGCENCGFLWNRAFDPGKLSYGEDYENDQTASAVFNRHVDAVVQIALASAPGELDYVEIGCGQGHFLRRLATAAGARLRSAVGFDPAWRKQGAALPANALVIPELFSQAQAGAVTSQPGLVVSRHTIEHVQDPVAFLTAARLLGRSGDSRIVLETPCAEWILRHRAFHDLFYEHCSIFSAKAMGIALARSGWQLERIDRLFGEQYLIAVARPATGAPAIAAPPVFLSSLIAERSRYVSSWIAEVKQTRQHGRVAGWGAGAKGATFANMVDPDGALIECFIDINPGKQGGFLPCTGHEVLSPETARERDPRHILVMNPNYLGEIGSQCRTLGLRATLHAVE